MAHLLFLVFVVLDSFALVLNQNRHDIKRVRACSSFDCVHNMLEQRAVNRGQQRERAVAVLMTARPRLTEGASRTWRGSAGHCTVRSDWSQPSRATT